MVDVSDIPNDVLEGWRQGTGDTELPAGAAVAFSARALDASAGSWTSPAVSAPLPIAAPLGFETACTTSTVVATATPERHARDGALVSLTGPLTTWSAPLVANVGGGELISTGYATVLVTQGDEVAVLEPANGTVMALSPAVRVRHRFAMADDATIGFGLDADPDPVVSRAP